LCCDPHTLGSDQDIAAQVTFLRELTKELDESAKMINDLEWVRLEAQQRRARNAELAAGAKGSDNLEQRATEAESKLLDLHLTGRVEDSFRHPMDLYGKMMAVLANLGATGADLPPTNQQVEVNREFRQRLSDAREAYQQVMQSAGTAGAGGR
jgi:DNA mismatch repair ATPase MutS